MGLNNNSNNISNQFDILDIISIINFFIGLKNLNENMEQGSVQQTLQNKTHDIHEHLSNQDKKIDEILNRLEMIEIDNKRDIRKDN